MRVCVWTVAAWSAALATTAVAQNGQGFSLERYEPSPAGQWSFWIDHPRYHPEADLSAGLTLDYAHNPLVLGIERDGEFIEQQSVVEHQLYGHVDIALALVDRLELSLSVPIALYQDGEAGAGVEPADAAVGDPRLGALLRLVGDPMKDAASINLGVRVWIPADGNDANVGDDYARFAPRLVFAGGATSFLWSFTGEFLYRKEASIGALESGPGNSVGSELHLGLALALTDPEHREFAIGPEVAFSTTVVGGEEFDEDYTSTEVLLGGHYKFAEVFMVGLAGGLGALSSPGTPDGRVILRLAYAAEQEKESAPVLPEPPADRDQDGVFDSEDVCPDEHQGDMPDRQRRGCPRPDRDGDGVFDDEDACPDNRGERSDDPSKNGCPPPPDRDGDGVLDDDDACPDVPAGENPDPARNGCPRPDTDGDGVFDDEDQCVDVPKGDNPHPTKTGCPTIKDDAIVVDPIFFKTGKAELLPESIPVLQSVVEVLNTNPDIIKIRIEGHTDNQGRERFNLNLSKRRAKTVLTWLIKQGISRQRLESQGYGQSQPIADNETEEGRATNRRVMFVVVKAEPK
jgi:outer membrane protein OmpA-like peptidoglycan-associated protein